MRGASVLVSAAYQILTWYDLAPTLKPSWRARQGRPSCVKKYSQMMAGLSWKAVRSRRSFR
ncbi:hypothetical protein [Streptomyces sp. H27-C3]|uniref:hypothetical protein n=1 Tax=Streptomyces sp. H27-C3 TaxID=3046305 RepID=UPI0024B8A3A6|nr:hypothetical protein [Streptomyces sp. H27-C3]MDJ0463579.1 hypothetical protein [Streptomyces sp. H27-C3]